MAKKSQPDGTKNPVGRPRADIDPKILEELAGIGCTMIEMATVTGVCVDTLENNFSDVIKKGREDFKMSLRRRQWDVAMNGSRDKEHASPTMLIWLGKQMLGQRDKQELVGPNGGPLEVKTLTDVELNNRIAELLGKASARSVPEGAEDTARSKEIQ